MVLRSSTSRIDCMSLLHLGDYFTVLRDGRVVGEGMRGSVDRTWIVERMSGRAADAVAARNAQAATATILQVSRHQHAPTWQTCRSGTPASPFARARSLAFTACLEADARN